MSSISSSICEHGLSKQKDYCKSAPILKLVRPPSLVHYCSYIIARWLILLITIFEGPSIKENVPNPTFNFENCTQVVISKATWKVGIEPHLQAMKLQICTYWDYFAVRFKDSDSEMLSICRNFKFHGLQIRSNVHFVCHLRNDSTVGFIYTSFLGPTIFEIPQQNWY